PGIIVQELHYGPFATNWWIFPNTKNSQNKKSTPIRINMRIKFELNQEEFIIQVVGNNRKPGYVCELDIEAIIYSTSSAAINETYNKLFNTKTRFSGPSVLGFNNEIIVEQLQAEISNDLMDAAKKYLRINGSGCIAISKPIVSRI
ncbi:19940_t:CDS:2, partial [Racocetra fulgida]